VAIISLALSFVLVSLSNPLYALINTIFMEGYHVGDCALNPNYFISMLTFNVSNEYQFYLLIKSF
jgi:hypothetical protein